MDIKKMKNLKNKILYLVDTKNYVETNCFQSQLLSAFKEEYSSIDILPFYPESLWPIRSAFYKPHNYTNVISVLRLRTLHQVWPKLQKWLNGVPLTIYDQDPWEGYIDTAPTKGVYEVLSKNLNIKKIYVTAPFWASYLCERGHNASWVRMGIRDNLCSVGKEFGERPVDIGFRGALHPHRKIVFDELQNSGLNVTISNERLAYPAYMDYLQTLKFFTHDESSPWICGGQPISRSHSMWIKSVETAARGTFVLRNYHDGGIPYGLKDISLIQCYEHPSQAPDIVKKISKLDRLELLEIQRNSVSFIKNQNDWAKAVKIIFSGEDYPN